MYLEVLALTKRLKNVDTEAKGQRLINIEVRG